MSTRPSLLCHHLCPAQMSHLPSSCLLYITNAVTSPLCINFLLLLLGLWRSLHAAAIQMTLVSPVLWAEPSCLWPIHTLSCHCRVAEHGETHSHTPGSSSASAALWLAGMEVGTHEDSIWRVFGWTCQQATPTPSKPSHRAHIFCF